MLSTLATLGLGIAGGLALASSWCSRRSRSTWESLAGQGLLRLDGQGRVRRLGTTARGLLGFASRCDQPHLDDLPLVGLDAWLTELEADRAAGRSQAVAERDLEIESAEWSEGRLLRSRQPVHCRLLPRNAGRSVLPAWISLSVPCQDPEERARGSEVLVPTRADTSEPVTGGNAEGEALLEGMKVLLAEDLASNQVLLRFFLEKEGAQITLAESGSDALQQSRTGKYDLVFLDDELADLDGATASQALREEGFGGSIVLLTPHTDATVLERYRLAGCTDHLEKPFKSRELREMAERIAEELRDEYGRDEQRAGEQGDDMRGKGDNPGRRIDEQEELELVNEFVASLDERMNDLELALEAEDWEGIEALSHRLAGTAADYRMGDLSSLGAEIEELSRTRPGSPDLPHKIEDLRTVIHGVSGHQLIQEPRE